MDLKISKYAGIDIGSNAIRLLIMFVYEIENQPTQYKKSSLVRVPIRLGSDVFFNGEISKHNITRMKPVRLYWLMVHLSWKIGMGRVSLGNS